MAISSYGNLAGTTYSDIDSDATAELNIASGAATLLGAVLDNSQNSVAVYVKIRNATSYSVGSDHPAFIHKVKAGQVRHVRYGSKASGLALTAISIATVTTPGTAGVVNPPNPVTISLAVV